MSFGEQILTAVGGGGVLLLVVGFLVRSLIRHLLDKDFAAYRTKLEAECAGALERTKADLRKDLIEHEIRFRNIHEKVAETIAETYARLVGLQAAVGSYVAILEFGGEPSKEEKLTSVAQANDAFRLYFFPREIYFPADLAEKTRNLHAQLTKITNDFTFGRSAEASRGVPSPVDYWGKAFEEFQKDARPLLEDLRKEFQACLGTVRASREGTQVNQVEQ